MVTISHGACQTLYLCMGGEFVKFLWIVLLSLVILFNGFFSSVPEIFVS